jgi:hypothetical protein
MTVEEAPKGQWPKPFRPEIAARWFYHLHVLLAENSVYRWVAKCVEQHPLLYGAFTAVEKVSKERLFGCQMCGQCELPSTGYACPMTCPKQLRNGPCGGVSPLGRCEVHPDVRCVWVLAYERADAAGHREDFTLLQRPVDHREHGRSSWINYWQGRDDDMAVAGIGHPPMLRTRQETV